MIRVGLIAFFAFLAWGQPITIGEHVPHVLATEHPYAKPAASNPILVMKEVVYYPQATYIAIHFNRFELAPGDFVVIRSFDGDQHWTYQGLGRHNLGNSKDGFFATHLKGDMAIIEFYNVSGEPGYGFDIDFYGRGYSDSEIQQFWDMGFGEEMNLPEPASHHRSICTTDDTLEAKCYQVSEPVAYDKSRTVTRLTLNGNAHCTGWLIGCEGHVMTNQHCIGSQSELNDIDFEFMAEGADCETNCNSTLACSGTIEATGGTLVQVDAELDFALVIPDTSVASNTDLVSVYGYLQLRNSGAVLGERIYIPQHPAGWGKRLAMESSYPEDTSGFPTVVSLTETACFGGASDVGYWADTRGGSSGSPVLAYADHRVVALHHCQGDASCSTGGGGDDPNRAVPIEAVIAELGANIPNCALCQTLNPATGLIVVANGDNQIDLSWTVPVDGSASFNIYRAFGPCPQSDWNLIASDHPSSSYTDFDVSGGSNYAYQVRAFDLGTSCESVDSNCADATATGLCTIAPSSPTNLTVSNAYSPSCTLELDWDDAVANCGSDLVYNVYRSETSVFDPNLGNLIVSGLIQSSYLDTNVQEGVVYFYIVRAEDDTGNGSGPHLSGNEDQNLNEASDFATGPSVAHFEDDVESGLGIWVTDQGPANMSTNPWIIVSSNSHSPSNSWFVSDEATVKDQMLVIGTAISIPAASAALLEFWHRIDSEANFDGGVLEYSADSGSTWLDILAGNGGSIPANSGRFQLAGYNSTLVSGGSVPLPGRMAWSGDNLDWELVQIDLQDFNGMDVQFRWRFGCDATVSGVGWNIDDIRVYHSTPCSSDGCDLDSTIAQWPEQSVIDLVECVDTQIPAR